MQTTQVLGRDYQYDSPAPSHTEGYLLGPVLTLCRQAGARKLLDLGCGNGALCAQLAREGFEVTGCDPSVDGIRIAEETLPQLRFVQLGVYDDPEELGERDFDAVVCTEVIEHLALPRALPRFAREVLRPGGTLILSTPYHGYLKNLLIALAGKWDFHHTALWDGGHVKFWSRDTLTQLLQEQGFRVTHFLGAGRTPYLWKSMVLAAVKE